MKAIIVALFALSAMAIASPLLDSSDVKLASKDELIQRIVKLKANASTWVTKFETEGKTVIAVLFIDLQQQMQETMNIVIMLDESNPATKALLASYSTVLDGLDVQLSTLITKFGTSTTPSAVLTKDQITTKVIALRAEVKTQVIKFESEGSTVKAILFENIDKQLTDTLKTVIQLDESNPASKALLASYSTVMEGLDAEFRALVTKFP